MMRFRAGTRFALGCIFAGVSCGNSGDAVDGAAGAAPLDVDTVVQGLTWSGLLMNQLSGVCADVVGAPGTANGTPLQTYPCESSGYDAWGGPSDQQWSWDLETGFIRNQVSPNKCLDVVGAPGTENGAPVALYECELSGRDKWGGRTDQRWDYDPRGFVVNRLSGRCLDVAGAPGNSNHLSLQLWDCEGSGYNPNGSVTDQRWSGISASTGSGGAPGIPPSLATGGISSVPAGGAH